jgi:RimJ/RimL family protein N-acetyltransferase
MTGSMWPLHDLRVRTPRMELRYPREAEMEAMAALTGDIHDPADMPFRHPFTDEPSPTRERHSLQFHWRCRAELGPEAWSLPMAVVVDGRVVGAQDLLARDFARRRVVETGSWLARSHQGRGFGKEMRAAILHLAFAGLGAARALTGAYEDNAASLAVTRSLPYDPNGEEIHAPRGEARRELRFVMTRAAWETVRRDDIGIEGLDRCRELLGA